MSRRRKRKPLPTELFTLEIESLSHDGRGVGHLDGKAVFVDGALPNETVRVQYVALHRDYDEGKTIEVLKAAPERVEPKCEHFLVCGGCSLQHMSPVAQIQAKQDVLLQNLARIGKVTPANVLPAIQADIWQYRSKARLGVRYVAKKSKVLVGFREKRASFVTETEQCDILYASVGMRITELSTLIESLSIKESIPQIEIAADNEQTTLIFRILKPLNGDDTVKLTEFGQQYGFAIQAQPGGPKTIYDLIKPRQALRYSPYQDLQILFQPQDFTQVNSSVNRLMLKQALALLALEKDDQVLDLFCGLGNFSLPMALHAGSVVGVEGEQTMVTRAIENARLNHVDNVKFYAANLFDTDLLKQAQAWLAENTFNKVLIDPPRSGAQAALELIPVIKPAVIVYVSCNPGTLARDAGILVNEYGYELKQAGVMDMFPHTAHVEAMALFKLP